jgi:5-methylcytosine-specific restriction endonuclease McrA
MPIRVEDRSRYPKDWPARRKAVLERAGHKCEWCGVPNYGKSRKSGKRVVLTIAHLHPPVEDCRLANLVSLCQACHLEHDQEQHRRNRRVNAARRLEQDQRSLFEEEG